MTIYDAPVARLDGTPASLAEITGGKPALLVNVASKCGLTPQYSKLEELAQKYDGKLAVVGLPCNQFMGQEPGTPDEIAEFCSSSYGVTFPLTEKIEVNGENRHPIYGVLTELADEEGKTGDITWNFEKFLVTADGDPVARFGPRTEPDAEHVIGAIDELVG